MGIIVQMGDNPTGIILEVDHANDSLTGRAPASDKAILDRTGWVGPLTVPPALLLISPRAEANERE